METSHDMKEHGPARAEAIDPALARFLALFRQGRYWDSHEALEGAWRRNGSPFYKGLILYASAFVHAKRDNAHGVRAQLHKAVEHLSPFAPAYLGFDVDAILAHARQCLASIDEGAKGSRLPVPALEWEGSARARR